MRDDSHPQTWPLPPSTLWRGPPGPWRKPGGRPGGTPFGGDPAGDPATVEGARPSVGLNFAKPGKDKVALKGILPLPEDWSPEGLEVAVDVGGVTKTFTLDSKGKARTEAKDSLKISPRTGKLKVKFGKGDYAAEFEDERLTGAVTVKKVQRAVPITILMGGTTYRTTTRPLYTAKAGKKGRAK